MQKNKELAKSRSKGGKDFLTLISEMWKELEPVSKKNYQEMSRTEKAKYQEYLKTLPAPRDNNNNKNGDLEFFEDAESATRNLRPKISNEQMRRILNPAYDAKNLASNFLQILSKGAESFLKQNVQRSIRENKTKKLSERVLFDAIQKDFRLGFFKDVEGLFEDERLQDWSVRSKRKGNLKSKSKSDVGVTGGGGGGVGFESGENGVNLGIGEVVGENGSDVGGNGVETGCVKREDGDEEKIIKGENQGFESLEYLKKEGLMPKNSNLGLKAISPLGVKTQNGKNNKSMFDFFAKK